MGRRLTLLLLVFSTPAAASRIDVERWLTLPEVTRMAHQVVVAKIVRLDNVYNAVPCGRPDELFLAVLRAEAVVEQVMTGDQRLRGRHVWLLRTAPSPPCRSVILKEAYAGSIVPLDVKPNVRLLAYASNEAIVPDKDGQVYLDLVGMDRVDRLAEVQAALREGSQPPAASTQPSSNVVQAAPPSSSSATRGSGPQKTGRPTSGCVTAHGRTENSWSVLAGMALLGIASRRARGSINRPRPRSLGYWQC
jgi:hypothetical protein